MKVCNLCLQVDVELFKLASTKTSQGILTLISAAALGQEFYSNKLSAYERFLPGVIAHGDRIKEMQAVVAAMHASDPKSLEPLLSMMREVPMLQEALRDLLGPWPTRRCRMQGRWQPVSPQQ